MEEFTYFVPADKSNFWSMLKTEWYCHRLNTTPLWMIPLRDHMIRKLLGGIDGSPYNIQRPFHCTYGKNIYIGKNFYSNFNCVILDQAKVTIGDDVWIASGCIICPGVTIGHGAVIGAGSVVTDDIPANTLAYGVPCRVIRPITDEDRLGVDVDRTIAGEH